jgi:hypothetical protein
LNIIRYNNKDETISLYISGVIPVHEYKQHRTEMKVLPVKKGIPLNSAEIPSISSYFYLKLYTFTTCIPVSNNFPQ